MFHASLVSVVKKTTAFLCMVLLLMLVTAAANTKVSGTPTTSEPKVLCTTRNCFVYNMKLQMLNCS